jgi:hypothetical protein
MAYSLPSFKSLRFLSVGKSNDYRSCYRSQRPPDLAKMNRPLFSDDSYPSCRTVTVQTCSTLRWSSGWIFRLFYFIFTRPRLRNRASESLCPKNIFFLVLWCSFTFRKFGWALSVNGSTVYRMRADSSAVCSHPAYSTVLYRVWRYQMLW